MANVKAELKGDLLTLVVDVSKAARDAAVPSKGIKKDGSKSTNKIVATTGGFTQFGDIKVNLTAMF